MITYHNVKTFFIWNIMYLNVREENTCSVMSIPTGTFTRFVPVIEWNAKSRFRTVYWWAVHLETALTVGIDKHFPAESVEITNKMQPCNRIYYSNVYWRLNMFWAAYRSSSGALNCIYSFWFTYCNKVKDFVYIIHSPY